MQTKCSAAREFNSTSTVVVTSELLHLEVKKSPFSPTPLSFKAMLCVFRGN